jgi:hypothetical protein
MSRAAFTIKAFAAYLFVLGGVFVATPNLLLSMFGIPTNEGWVRVVGLLAFNIGAYAWVAARHEVKVFFAASVWMRTEVFVVLGGLAALGLIPPIVAVFGIADLAGGLWTHLALRADARHAELGSPRAA